MTLDHEMRLQAVYDNRGKILGFIAVGLLAWNLRLHERLAAKPMVQDRVVTKTVQGPTRVEVRTIIKPGGEKIVERVRTVESKTTERASEHVEVPACPRVPTRYAGVGVTPGYWTRPRLSAGLTFGGRLDAGAFYDARYEALGLEARYRW